jgi:hypothetical protein
MVFHLVTVATHSQGYFDTLVSSCERHGHVLNVLGWGQPWKGFGQKLNYLTLFIRDHTQPDDVVMFIDAFDVVMLSCEADIMNAFSEFESIHGGGEDSCKIWMSCCSESMDVFQKALKHWYFGDAFINSGTYIGRACAVGSLLEKAEALIDGCDGDDQKAFVVVTKATDLVVADDARKLAYIPKMDFGLFPNTADMHVVRDRILINGVYPLVIHGAECFNMDDIIHRLGYVPVSRFSIKDKVKYFKHCTATQVIKKLWTRYKK